MPQENNKQIVLEKLPRKETVNTNPVGLLKSFLVIFYVETKAFPQIKQHETIFISNGNKLRRRPAITLPTVSNTDLALIQHPIRLHLSKDPAEITDLSQDRKRWMGLTSQIEEAAEVT